VAGKETLKVKRLKVEHLDHTDQTDQGEVRVTEIDGDLGAQSADNEQYRVGTLARLKRDVCDPEI